MSTPFDIEPLCAIAREAGRQIRELYDPQGAHWSKEDHSPLTKADLRSHDVIDSGLRAAFPGIPV